MKTIFLFLGLFISLIVASQNSELPIIETGSLHPMPQEWIDKDTGHKVVRLTVDGKEKHSFYFHNNPFLEAQNGAKGKMIFYGRADQNMQLFSVDMGTYHMNQITDKSLIADDLIEIVGKKGRQVYYQCNDSVFATDVDNLQTKLIFVFPDSIQAQINSINADETLLAGKFLTRKDVEIYDKIIKQNLSRGERFVALYEAKLPHSLFTVQIKTGEFKKIHTEKAMLNHIQFSPTDPGLLMFSHEGPWSQVDRIWTININGDLPRLMHKRTMENEIAGHEFFSPDGKWIWFDLQIPQGERFYLSGVNVLTDEVKRYKLTRNEWSVHYTISPDQKLFAGDGGDPTQVAKAGDGMWIYLFHPEEDSLRSERLVNMKNHNYRTSYGRFLSEPNVHFSPDGKWVIFRANFDGYSDIYAVETAKYNE
ncbi:MAG: oligogalacturonate lyase family protein [Prolixibacteraceae bacterium]|jgi:oligogalacturonide lyase|nr:oligogalacturonate lyase family protein [Prolixibacteraceae bacterium]